MNRIIGLDVGRGSAVLCCLEKFPDNILLHYRKLRNEKKFYRASCNKAGIDLLLSLKPTGIVLEPTGHWYSQFWVIVASQHNISIYWVGHNDLDSKRKGHGFANKRDEEDALCLAALYFDDQFIDIRGQKRFLKLTHSHLITKIRELFNEKEQLQKLRTNLVSVLRQRLSYEYPEAACHSMTISPTKGYSPFIYWLATLQKCPRYDNKYAQSVAHELNINISHYTRAHALMIHELELRFTDTVEQIEAAIHLPQFDSYHRVFDRFLFGTTVRALLLFNFYPFEKYLVNGKPWIEYERSKNKLQKRNRSLRKFQAYAGLSFSYKQSGDKVSRKFHGNATIRSHLYMWAICTITRKSSVHHTDITQELSDRYQELRKTARGKDATTRILFKVTRMLFYELTKETRT